MEEAGKTCSLGNLNIRNTLKRNDEPEANFASGFSIPVADELLDGSYRSVRRTHRGQSAVTDDAVLPVALKF